MEIPQAVLDRMTDRDAAAVVDTLVVHHTADNDQDQDIADIAREEMADQDFVTVGYHAVIKKDGTIQYGRPIDKVPAAALDYNTRSVDVALEGNFHPSDANYIGEKPSDAQIHALIGYVRNVLHKCPRLSKLIGHRDVARLANDRSVATACPGDLLYNRLHDVRVATGLHIA